MTSDLVFTIGEYPKKQDDTLCTRCGEPVGDRVVLVVYTASDDSPCTVPACWCVPCFLVKYQTWSGMAKWLRGDKSALVPAP